jgi:hypothetical protein
MSNLNEHEIILRRALRAAADGIEPRADGLERIRARLRPPRPLALVWAEAVWTAVQMRGADALQVALEWLRSVINLAWERFGPTSRTTDGRASRSLGWLRPAVALGMTVFIVAAGAYVAIDAQQAIFPSSSTGSTGGAGSGGGSHGKHGGTGARSHSTLGSPGSGTPAPKTTCRPARSPSAGASASTGPASSPAASPSGSSSSSSPSPSPTDSSSPNPSATLTGQTVLSTEGATGASALSTAGGLSRSAILTRAVVATATLPPCTKKSTRRSSPTTQPNATPAVIGFGKLDDGS